MRDFHFLEGIYTHQLRDLYKDVKLELKKRGQLHILKRDSEIRLTPKHYYKTNSVPRIKDSKGIIIDGRNNDRAGDYEPPKRWHHQNSILIDFLHEDWSFLFPNADNKKRKYYVYYHLDPNTDRITVTKSVPYENKNLVRFAGVPFYIGKGCGKRFKSLNNRSTSHINLVNTYLKIGYEITDICKILIDGLTELEALELESKLIAYFGCYTDCLAVEKKYLTGLRGGVLINSDRGKRPFWVEDLINIQCGILKIANNV